MSKLKQLEALCDQIHSSIEKPWLFPTRGAVQGFLGTGSVMFVGERPSTGNFGGPSDSLLYSLLEKHGVADAHLTDVIKTRGKVGEPYPDMYGHREVFDRELDILKPRMIIAFGQKVHDLLRFCLAEKRTPIRTIWHYSYTRRGSDKVPRFEEQLKRALQSDLASISGDAHPKGSHSARGRETLPQTMKQRELMRELFARHGGNEDSVVAAYAVAERSGRVQRVSDNHKLSSEEYGMRLFYDGTKKGWIYKA
ncbi:MAG: uracil-DNA glycosylase family protein [Elusimicrobiota bacterium]